MRPRATSVTVDSEPDGWQPDPGFASEMDPASGNTRLLVQVGPRFLPRVHLALVRALEAPLSVLYRQQIDRNDPRPEGAPPKDFVALELGHDKVVAAMEAHPGVVWEDARAELWVRGGFEEKVVLDQDGLLYCYPDDPVFRDVLMGFGLEERDLHTLLDRDYVKHWYYAENDAQEVGLVEALGLVEVPPRGAG